MSLSGSEESAAGGRGVPRANEVVDLLAVLIEFEENIGTELDGAAIIGDDFVGCEVSVGVELDNEAHAVVGFIGLGQYGMSLVVVIGERKLFRDIAHFEHPLFFTFEKKGGSNDDARALGTGVRRRMLRRV
jgi:hypothetical protein